MFDFPIELPALLRMRFRFRFLSPERYKFQIGQYLVNAFCFFDLIFDSVTLYMGRNSKINLSLSLCVGFSSHKEVY